MIEFKRLDKDVLEIKKYLDGSDMNFCDISVGTKYLWRNDFVIDYTVVKDTLIMKESCPDYKDAFYYPIGSDIDGALGEIEEYCQKNNLPLKFCCIDNDKAVELTKRYDKVNIFNNRNWSDYIYDAEAFKTYKGKKYSGQRNHVNKFKRQYPDYSFEILSQNELENIDEFFREYERENVMTMWSEKEEAAYVADYIKNSGRLFQSCGVLKVGGKTVGISAGEIVSDTLIVHVEKALKSYDGVYPALAQEYAKAFATEKVKYINREEDCGDPGLRISKMQYHPIEIKEKNLVCVFTPFDNIEKPVLIKTERLCVTDITKQDKSVYYRLQTDTETNKYWGYDYKEDLPEDATEEDFYRFQQELKDKKEEYTFAVRSDGKYVGELVLYGFGYRGEAEIGFRFLPEFRGKGYATESCRALIEYARDRLQVKKLKARCFKQNTESERLIEKLGFKRFSEDEQKFYYIKKLS